MAIGSTWKASSWDSDAWAADSWDDAAVGNSWSEGSWVNGAWATGSWNQASFTLQANPGQYALSGTSATLQVDILISAEGGSYTLTGADVTLKITGAESPVLEAEAGTYTLTGATDTVLGLTKKADAGQYWLTGADVQFYKGRTVSAEGGTYTQTGAAAGLHRGYKLSAESGSFTQTGAAASLKYGRKLHASPAASDLTEFGWTDEAQFDSGHQLGYQNFALRYQYDGAANGRFDGLEFYVAAGSGNVRVGIYESATGVLTGAPLIEDLGIVAVSGAGWYSVEGKQNPVFEVGKHYFFAFRSGGNAYIQFKIGSGGGGWLTMEPLDENDAGISWPATGPAWASAGTAAQIGLNFTCFVESIGYVTTGAAVSLLGGWKIAAAGGTYELTGAAVDLIAITGPNLIAGPGSYVLTGADANLRLSRIDMDMDPGSYALTGADVNFILGVAELDDVLGSLRIRRWAAAAMSPAPLYED